MTKNGIELIKKYEGCRLEAYRCPAGVWTIGYGHTKGVREGQRVSREEAERMLVEDLQYYENMVGMLVAVPLTGDQVGALVSLAYNIGVEALRKSTVLKLINAGAKEAEVRKAWAMWNKAGGKVLPGLAKRREAELALFFND